MCNSALGTEQLQFEVNDKIEIVKIWIYPNGNYAVDIALKHQYAKELSTLTGTNIGKPLQILLSGQLLIGAVIHARSDSGTIRVGEWKSPQQALKVVEELLLGPPNEKSPEHKSAK
jgi:preprotein translocase subunit SecD